MGDGGSITASVLLDEAASSSFFFVFSASTFVLNIHNPHEITLGGAVFCFCMACAFFAHPAKIEH